jgi:WD40 repeat protein
MNDGRLVSGSWDKSIIIYNKESYKPQLIIKEHNNNVNSIT